MSTTVSKIVKFKCPDCEQDAIEKYRMDIGSSKIVSLSCGHLIAEDKLGSAELDYNFASTDGKTLRQYQKDGIKFIESSNVRTLVADEQGLGKTIQALGTLRLHPELTPALVVTKTTVKRQWYFEILRWCAENKYIVQVMHTGKEKALPGFDIYICSYDFIKNEKAFEDVKLQTIILDECQAIKNHLSGRAKVVQDLARTIPHAIALSGTPIKNNAGEYFTILNLLQPSRFPTYQGYLKKYCDAYEDFYSIKVGGLVNPEQFKIDTEDFIIRRTRKEAAPEIPEVDRQFYHVEFNKKFHNAYKEGLKELEELMYSEKGQLEMAATKIAIMTRLRKITGLSKVPDCVEYVEEFLENETDRKLTIFAHHHDVVNLLEIQLNKLLESKGYNSALNLHAGLSGNHRSDVADKFKSDPKRRILIASTLAAGEGLNLQFCSRAIMLERQWNPANEEQAEGRFARIGQEDNIVVSYMIATGTIDEYFTELVEGKRAIVKSTLGGEVFNWDEPNLMKELAETLIRNGMKSWKL
jgi:SNF2 family DNA or RNA helicase